MTRLYLLLLTAWGCAERAALLENAPCPCSDDGFVCCPRSQTCTARDACEELRDRLQILSVTPERGPLEGGIPLDVAGEAIAEDTVVEVGGVRCPVLDRTPTMVRCLLPPGHRFRPVVGVSLVSATEVVTLPDAFRYQQPAFTDVTRAVGFGTPGWGSGILLYDANGNGRTDILFSVGSSLQRGSLLYENLGGLRFRDVTTPRMVQVLVAVDSLAAADFTNDGLTDVFFANHREVSRAGLMIATHPDGRDPEFASIVVSPQRAAQAVSAVDLDADGFIDIVGCRGSEADGQRTDQRMFVGMNRGGEIEDDTSRYRQDPTLRIECTTSAIGDVDRDGDVDMVGCTGEARLSGSAELVFFENREGVFEPATERVEIDPLLGHACRSMHLVDIDGDGDLDLSYTRTASLVDGGAGGVVLLENRLAQEGELRWRRFVDASEDRAALCPEATRLDGATLLGGVGSSVWMDRDMDGDLDLVLPMPAARCAQPGMWYENRSGPSSLYFVSHPLGLQGIAGTVSGAAAADLDGDGDLDVVTSEWGPKGGRAIVRNNAAENGELGRYLVVRAISDPDGDATDGDTSDDRVQPGVTIELDLSGSDFSLGDLRVAPIGGRGHKSAGPIEARFGLGERTQPVWVGATFPDGSRVTRQVSEFNRIVELRDCAEVTCDGP